MSDEIKADNPFTGKKILWVEDDKFLSDLIAKKLAGRGAVLSNTANGEEAVALIEKENPDVVLLDIILPGMNGLAVLEKMRLSEKTKRTPVLILSNLGQKEDIDKASRLGVEKFFIKATITLDEIVDELETIFKKKTI